MKTGAVKESFEKYKAANGANQSVLKKLSHSPAHLRYYLDHPEPPSRDLIMGRVFDVAIFEPDKLETCCHVIPTHYDGKDGRKPWHGGATFCKEWIAAHQDKEQLSSADFTAVLLMRDSVTRHPAACAALTQGGGGYSLYCEDSETGLQLKARPDWMSGEVIIDLKSCQDASEEGFASTIAKFGYDIQAAFYLDLAGKLKLGKERFWFICCEKEPPYAVAVHELGPRSIETGRSKYRRYLQTYMECVSTGVWPGYSPNVNRIEIREWAIRAEENQKGPVTAFVAE